MPFNPIKEARGAINNTYNNLLNGVENLLGGSQPKQEAGRDATDKISFYDLAWSNPNALVTIIGSRDGNKQVPIMGVLTSDFNFNTSASWSGVNQDSNAKNYMSKLVEGWKGAMNRWNDTAFKQGILQWAGETVVKWDGTSPVTFSIPLVFVATHPGDDVLKPVVLLQRGIFPTFESPNNPLVSSMTAPNDYSVGDINNTQGRYGVIIGKWFRTPQLFVITAVDFTVSKEVIGSGRPLYVSGSVSFQSSRILSYDEVRQMFILSQN